MQWILGLLGVGAIMAAFVLFFVAGPFIVLWALNALGFTVAYTFWTWLAAFALLVMFKSGVTTREK